MTQRKYSCACAGVTSSESMCGYIIISSGKCGAPDAAECVHQVPKHSAPESIPLHNID